MKNEVDNIFFLLPQKETQRPQPLKVSKVWMTPLLKKTQNERRKGREDGRAGEEGRVVCGTSDPTVRACYVPLDVFDLTTCMPCPIGCFWPDWGVFVVTECLPVKSVYESDWPDYESVSVRFLRVLLTWLWVYICQISAGASDLITSVYLSDLCGCFWPDHERVSVRSLWVLLTWLWECLCQISAGASDLIMSVYLSDLCGCFWPDHECVSVRSVWVLLTWSWVCVSDVSEWFFPDVWLCTPCLCVWQMSQWVKSSPVSWCHW